MAGAAYEYQSIKKRLAVLFYDSAINRVHQPAHTFPLPA
jgi:hypothetical protein